MEWAQAVVLRANWAAKQRGTKTLLSLRLCGLSDRSVARYDSRHQFIIKAHLFTCSLTLCPSRWHERDRLSVKTVGKWRPGVSQWDWVHFSRCLLFLLSHYLNKSLSHTHPIHQRDRQGDKMAEWWWRGCVFLYVSTNQPALTCVNTLLQMATLCSGHRGKTNSLSITWHPIQNIYLSNRAKPFFLKECSGFYLYNAPVADIFFPLNSLYI